MRGFDVPENDRAERLEHGAAVTSCLDAIVTVLRKCHPRVIELAMRTRQMAIAISSLLAVLLTTMLSGRWDLANGEDVVAVNGNHPSNFSWALPDASPLAGDQVLKMEIVFAVRNRPALDQLLTQQQDPLSPQFRRWLKSQEFTNRFGPSETDLASVRSWLTEQGFAVRAESRDGRYTEFTVTVAQVESSFRVAVVGSSDGKRFANTSDPMIPARFQGVVAGIRGLDNLLRFRRVGGGSEARVDPEFNAHGRGPDAFGPRDLWTFYDETPPLTAQSDGSGSGCIAVIEVSEFLDGAVSLFNKTFALPAASISRVYTAGRPPRDPEGAEIETLSDIEYAHGIAPGARIVVYLNSSDLLPSIRAAVTENRCSAISISFGFCSSDQSLHLGLLDPLYAQAASQGQSVFVASGDFGAAALNPDCSASSNRGVSETAASPNVTAVGGTQFFPNYNGGGNDVGDVPEEVWNEKDSAHGIFGASGGGASNIFPKPSYQTGPGVPDDSKRDLPDVSLAAGVVFRPGFYAVIENHGSAGLGCCLGGTSIGTPIWAGITELLTQKLGQRVGNLNPTLYQLGQKADPAAGLRDVTSGDNGFPRTGVAGFSAGPGYDLATGWGTPDIATFIAAFAAQGTSPPVAVPAQLKVTPGTLTFGKSVVLGNVGAPSTPKSIALTNPKDAKQDQTIIVQGLNATGDFSIPSESCLGLLLPGTKCNVPIVFTPTAAGKRSGTIVVSANTVAPAPPIGVLGTGMTGTLTYAPKMLNFGKVATGGSSQAKTVTLTNKNAVPMELGAITASEQFKITVNSCGSTLSASGGACSVSVAFAPSMAGKLAGSLTIQDNAAGNPHTVKLAGVGIAPPAVQRSH